MALLITGGFGLLGPFVAKRYLEIVNDEVVLFDIETKDMELLKEFKNRIKAIKGDITDYNQLESIFKKNNIDKVAHLAAIADVDVSENNPHKACNVNVMGTVNMLELCRTFNIKRMVYASTGAVYGKTKGPVLEDFPLNPADIYGATKAMSEMICLQYRKSYNIDVIINRLYFLYGPGMFFEPISPFGIVKSAFEGRSITFEKGGDQQFEFTHVKDAAEGIVLSITKDLQKTNNYIFNISNGKTIKLTDFALIVKKHFPNAKIFLGAGELGISRGFPLDINRAKKELGYEAKINIEEGIKETILWLENN